jgi:hypothetical protein
MHAKLLAGFVSAAFVLASLCQAAEPQKRPGTRQDSDMARAIAFQRQKDAADARQARLEAKRPSVSYSNSAERSADRVSGNQVGDPGEGQYQREKEKDTATPHQQ